MLAIGDFGGVICCLQTELIALDFVRKATALRPDLRLILVVPFAWSDAAAALAGQSSVLFVLSELRPAFARANIDRFLNGAGAQPPQAQLLQRSVNGSVTALFEVLSIVDPYSASLGQRLRYAVDLFCKSAGIPMTWELETGALLAEIGVLTVPVRVITRAHSGQELSNFERDMLAHIPERGADLLQHMPAMAEAARVVRFQDKNFDGSGLPVESLAGHRIPLGARILKVVNDLFKLKENGKNQEDAIAEMEQRNGRYDPALVQIARECFNVSLPTTMPGNTEAASVKELRPGQLLVSSVETDDGVLVIRDGQVVSPRLLHKLRNFAFTSGIREPIYVIDLLKSREMTTTFQNLAQSETAFFVKNS